MACSRFVYARPGEHHIQNHFITVVFIFVCDQQKLRSFKEPIAVCVQNRRKKINIMSVKDKEVIMLINIF